MHLQELNLGSFDLVNVGEMRTSTSHHGSSPSFKRDLQKYAGRFSGMGTPTLKLDYQKTTLNVKRELLEVRTPCYVNHTKESSLITCVTLN